MIALLVAAAGLIVAVIGCAIIDPSGQSTRSLFGCWRRTPLGITATSSLCWPPEATLRCPDCAGLGARPKLGRGT